MGRDCRVGDVVWLIGDNDAGESGNNRKDVCQPTRRCRDLSRVPAIPSFRNSVRRVIALQSDYAQQNVEKSGREQ